MAVEFKERWFAKELILQCIRRHLTYKLSYRDLEEMMAERGLRVDYSNLKWSRVGGQSLRRLLLELIGRKVT